ncbi:MAG: hypothetical protein RJA25_2232 [Bacteroidota bacterium]
MKLINNILYLEFAELVSCGVSDLYIKKAKSIGTSCWTFLNDPEDKRKVLIKYEDLKPKYKNMVLAKFGNPYTYIAETALEKYMERDYDARYFYTQYEIPATGKKLSDEHIEQYVQGAELLNLLVKIRSKNGKALLNRIAPDKVVFWQMVAEYIDKKGIELPKNYNRILEKVRQYTVGDGNQYDILVSGKFGTANSEKINEVAAEWLIAQYSMPTVNLARLFAKYNQEAEMQGWKPLKHENSLYMFLHREEIKPQWYLGKFGETAFVNKYGYQIKTILPTMRDALWYGDGTKLNYYYQDEKGNICTMVVYEVIDVFSECLLGYSTGETENSALQYPAYKMALNFSGQKPYEIRYDNQGGHKLLKSSFLDKLSHLGFACRPYNGKSKTIESIFGRLQQEVLSQDWFFTGQNVKAKKMISQGRRDIAYKNKQFLPTKEEVIKAYEKRREEWNNRPHPKEKCTRLERYLNSYNPKAQPLDDLQKMEIFWVQKDKHTTYYTSGITLTLGDNKYEYEVLTSAGLPDIEFRRKHIGGKFYIKYDPMDLSHIRLYELTPKGLRFVAGAEPRIEIHRATQDLVVGERALLNDLLAISPSEVAYRKEEQAKREDATGVSIYNEINPNYKGTLSGHLMKPKQDYRGEIMKAESLMEDEDDESVFYNI